jgi:omega-hydroxy-beta-dihydromenaquinone-9 sulfotransferase
VEKPALEEANRLPSRAIVHVRFEELERNPLAQLERIYGSIQLGDFEPARPRIEANLDSVRDYSKSSDTFSRESIAGVTERWQPFVTRLGYPPPALERCAA